jgi:hypothetical protein
MEAGAVSVPVLTFVLLSRRVHLRMSEPKGHCKISILVWVLDLTFALKTRGESEANAKSTTPGAPASI